jgi:catechol 1,2-dioxygenase
MISKRNLLRAGILGAAGLSIAAPKLVLPANAQATPASGQSGAERYVAWLKRFEQFETQSRAVVPHQVAVPVPASLTGTEDNLLGPFYRPGAPTIYSISAPHEPGVMMIISGRLWSSATRQPIPGGVIHIWRADMNGRYDNSDPRHPPKPDVFVNRGIIYTDINGAYAYITVHPGKYWNLNQYRPPHIHYMVFADGHVPLITQLYFDGEPENKIDPFIKQSLIIKLSKQQSYGKTIEVGTFDIVLDPL